MKKFFGLGKGLGSLIPTTVEITPKMQKENIFYVEINKIKPNPDQPRKDLDEEGLKELSKSIRRFGILQPLLVSKVEIETQKGLDVSYVLIAGERRWRAAQLAGLPHVPVIIRDDFDEKKARLEVALIENIQRKDLNVLEEAEAYDRFQKEFGLTHKEIAEKVSKSREVISNAIRLLALPKDIKEAIRNGKISRTHARALLAFNDEKKQRDVFQQILKGGLAVRDMEIMAIEGKLPLAVNSVLPANPALKKDGKFKELEKNLGETLSAPVVIHAGASGGRIVIRFATLEDLNKIAKSIID